jgi:hypothetical protein
MEEHQVAFRNLILSKPGCNAADEREAYSERFRKVSTRYPRRVAEAYAGHLHAAMDDTDEDVAATVARWEEAEGLEVRDWHAIGAQERRP